MKKNKLILAFLLVLTTTVSIFADGETGHGNRSLIEYVYDEFGNIIQTIITYLP